MSKRTLCLDFDGVIHSYVSGWQGARVVTDPPVAGALEFVVTALESFDVCVYSSRSSQWGGRSAMKRWLFEQLSALASTYESTPAWLLAHIHAFADPWPDEVAWDMRRIVYREIRWPLFKPAAFLTIDDRALTFKGTWPTFEEIHRFRPWKTSMTDSQIRDIERAERHK